RTNVLHFDLGNDGKMTSEHDRFRFVRVQGGGPFVDFNLNPSNSFHFSFVGNMSLTGRMATTELLEANGGLIVPTGQIKAFYHDLGDGTGIYYCSLEGPESTNFL